MRTYEFARESANYHGRFLDRVGFERHHFTNGTVHTIHAWVFGQHILASVTTTPEGYDNEHDDERNHTD